MQIEYIMKESKPKDGKLLAIGHSMGGILLYSMLSRFGKFSAFWECQLTINHFGLICYHVLIFVLCCLKFVMA